MSPSALLQLGLATGIFVAAASGAKAWALAPSLGRAAATLLLYTAGNLVMLRLVRLVGMATAFSLSAVAQLVAVNLVAILFFGERVGRAEGLGLVLAILAVALITLGPRVGALPGRADPPDPPGSGPARDREHRPPARYDPGG